MIALDSFLMQISADELLQRAQSRLGVLQQPSILQETLLSLRRTTQQSVTPDTSLPTALTPPRPVSLTPSRPPVTPLVPNSPPVNDNRLQSETRPVLEPTDKKLKKQTFLRTENRNVDTLDDQRDLTSPPDTQNQQTSQQATQNQQTTKALSDKQHPHETTVEKPKSEQYKPMEMEQQLNQMQGVQDKVYEMHTTMLERQQKLLIQQQDAIHQQSLHQIKQVQELQELQQAYQWKQIQEIRKKMDQPEPLKNTVPSKPAIIKQTRPPRDTALLQSYLSRTMEPTLDVPKELNYKILDQHIKDNVVEPLQKEMNTLKSELHQVSSGIETIALLFKKEQSIVDTLESSPLDFYMKLNAKKPDPIVIQPQVYPHIGSELFQLKLRHSQLTAEDPVFPDIASQESRIQRLVRDTMNLPMESMDTIPEPVVKITENKKGMKKPKKERKREPEWREEASSPMPPSPKREPKKLESAPSSPKRPKNFYNVRLSNAPIFLRRTSIRPPSLKFLDQNIQKITKIQETEEIRRPVSPIKQHRWEDGKVIEKVYEPQSPTKRSEGIQTLPELSHVAVQAMTETVVETVGMVKPISAGIPLEVPSPPNPRDTFPSEKNVVEWLSKKEQENVQPNEKKSTETTQKPKPNIEKRMAEWIQDQVLLRLLARSEQTATEPRVAAEATSIGVGTTPADTGAPVPKNTGVDTITAKMTSHHQQATQHAQTETALEAQERSLEGGLSENKKIQDDNIESPSREIVEKVNQAIPDQVQIETREVQTSVERVDAETMASLVKNVFEQETQVSAQTADQEVQTQMSEVPKPIRHTVDQAVGIPLAVRDVGTIVSLELAQKEVQVSPGNDFEGLFIAYALVQSLMDDMTSDVLKTMVETVCLQAMADLKSEEFVKIEETSGILPVATPQTLSPEKDHSQYESTRITNIQVSASEITTSIELTSLDKVTMDESLSLSQGQVLTGVYSQGQLLIQERDSTSSGRSKIPEVYDSLNHSLSEPSSGEQLAPIKIDEPHSHEPSDVFQSRQDA
ncbi:hypothetical protein EDD86DRAFT_198239 [Gorgonomyces haynaldii]|nr:hypothetical protein EDD86DRAFT_198239 [Gorgonomyces haynaldii]